MRMTWKALTKTLGVAAHARLASVGAADAQVTLKAVMHSDLKIVDPIWTTAYITRNHGYMIYDTLFAMDEKGEIKPQMVENVRRQAPTSSPTPSRCATASSGTTARRSPPRTASPRSSAGAPRTRSARS